jgi:hypothetical protein
VEGLDLKQRVVATWRGAAIGGANLALIDGNSIRVKACDSSSMTLRLTTVVKTGRKSALRIASRSWRARLSRIKVWSVARDPIFPFPPLPEICLHEISGLDSLRELFALFAQ